MKLSRRLAVGGLCLTLSAGVTAAADISERAATRRPLDRVCEPALPLTVPDVPGDLGDEGIRACEVIASPEAWADFCADNGFACDLLDDAFFADWTVVAVVVATSSPYLCENAGQVPWWEVGCIQARRRSALVRVELTLAGSACQCTMGPQTPVLRVLAEAVPHTTATSCIAWQESHTVECLGP